MLSCEISSIIQDLSPEDAIAELSSSITDWEADYDKLSKRNIRLTSEAMEHREKAANLEAEIARLTKELAFAQKANRQHVRDLNDSRDENARLRASGMAVAV